MLRIQVEWESKLSGGLGPKLRQKNEIKVDGTVMVRDWEAEPSNEREKEGEKRGGRREINKTAWGAGGEESLGHWAAQAYGGDVQRCPVHREGTPCSALRAW